MGLCPDCRNEGETVTYVGGSKDDVLKQGAEGEEADDADTAADDEPDSVDRLVCDLCETEYGADGE